MAKVKKTNSNLEGPKRMQPAMTPEERENQIIAAAMNLAERQILEGTASSQVISHFLKLGSTKEKLEKELMAEQKKLLAAKTENLQVAKQIEELYSNAIASMKKYSGASDEND